MYPPPITASMLDTFMEYIARFIKIAQQLDSDEDNIRLIALQKCQNILRDNNETWFTFLSKLSPNTTKYSTNTSSNYTSSHTTANKTEGSDYGFGHRRWSDIYTKKQQHNTKNTHDARMSIIVDTSDAGFVGLLIQGTIEILHHGTTRHGNEMIRITIHCTRNDTNYVYPNISVFDAQSIAALRRGNRDTLYSIRLRESKGKFPATGKVITEHTA